MAVYADIPNPEVDIDTPAKSSTAKKFRDNPLAIFEGDPTALAAGKGVAIEKAGQTAVITDDVDVDKVLTPDGAGGAQWSSGVSGMVLVERKEIAAAVTTVSFAGLNGNVHEVYKLIARISKPIVGAAVFNIQPNGSAALAATNAVNNGVTGTILGPVRLITSVVPVSYISLEILIHAREIVQALAFPRLFQGKVMETDLAAGNVPQVIDLGAIWNGAGNIITLDITGTLASSIGIGSTFELFKLAQ